MGVAIDTPTFLCVKKTCWWVGELGGAMRNDCTVHPFSRPASAHLGALALRIELLCDRGADPRIGAATNPQIGDAAIGVAHKVADFAFAGLVVHHEFVVADE